MKKMIVGVLLLAALGAACAKAGQEPSEARAAPVSADALQKAVMAEAGLTNLTGTPVIGLADGLMKAAMVEAGITNISGTTPFEGSSSGGPHHNVGPHPFRSIR